MSAVLMTAAAAAAAPAVALGDAPTTNSVANSDFCDKTILDLVNETNLSKIENFFEDTAYKEAIESSSNYNSRLCRERRHRMPFLDSQTGVAQYHSSLFVTARQRMPGLENGQIYTYPSKRWRKKRRQYLINFFQPRKFKMDLDDGLDIHFGDNATAGGASEDSKDSLALKDEHSKDAWYYDDTDMLDLDPYDEPDPDSDYDYEESYRKRSRRKPRGGGHHPARGHPSSSDSAAGRRSKGGGRGRRKANYDPSDSDKPFVCDRGSRRGRGGNSGRATSPSMANTSVASPGGTPNLALQPQVNIGPPLSSEHHSQLNHGLGLGGGVGVPGEIAPPGSPTSASKDNGTVGEPGAAFVDEPHLGHHHHAGGDVKKEKPVTPSPYCDFCLGNARENKKTGGSEELVSCSDCGRSGKKPEATTNGANREPAQGDLAPIKGKRKYTRRGNNNN